MAEKKTAPKPLDRSKERLDALAREREGYVTRGLDDRVEQVDAEIKANGGKPPRGKAASSAKPNAAAPAANGNQPAA